MNGSRSAISHLRPRIPLRGNDIDTDRIMPARFLRAVSFEGLEKHLFEDDRAADPAHPFNDAALPRRVDPGGQRELRLRIVARARAAGTARYGIRAIIGESFSEIFQGNAAMLGHAVLRRPSRRRVERLQALIETTPELSIEADVETGVITAGTLTIAGAACPPALRDAFLSGKWNPTAMLLDRVRGGDGGRQPAAVHRAASNPRHEVT